MSLIINDKIRMFKVGYPTVSDKYDVAGGILAGTDAVKFGEIVVKASETSEGTMFAKPGATISDVKNISGITLATNVKLADGFPGKDVEILPGEAFNLMLRGFIAVKVKVADVDLDEITSNASVGVFLAGEDVGKLTYVGNTSDSATAVALPSVVFTGAYEKHGTDVVAEIYIK